MVCDSEFWSFLTFFGLPLKKSGPSNLWDHSNHLKHAIINGPTIIKHEEESFYSKKIKQKYDCKLWMVGWRETIELGKKKVIKRKRIVKQ